ncbi:MAG: hypothetical protein QNK18_01485 [Gammaproteobacteria bacterium]|nr:hypothetical protein [Gammaproteobacteria bacterium]
MAIYRIATIGLALLAVSASPFTFATVLYGPTPYLGFADSPFAGEDLDYFFLEDFEDDLLNTPGVTASAGGVQGPNAASDSVDADDGAIDGSGVFGRDFSGWNLGGPGITFSFDAAVLGALPTHVGLVWTDGGRQIGGVVISEVTFEALDSLGHALGPIVGSSFSDNSFAAGTEEDRFFGVSDPLGISAMTIRDSSTSGAPTGLAVDHLQYGRASAVPEPSTLALLAIQGNRIL